MKKLVCAVAFLGCGLGLFAQSGALDFSFGVGGKAVTQFTDDNSAFSYTILQQPDGKIVVSYLRYGTPLITQMIRYNPNGSLDNTFGTNGIATVLESPDFGVVDMALLPDGKFILAMNEYSGATIDADFVLARVNTNGSLDNSFGSNGMVITDVGGAGDFPTSIKVQSDGKIVMAGYAIHSGSTLADFAVVRYNANGSLDQNFGTNGRQQIVFTPNYKYNTVSDLEIQPDGKIVLAGKALTPSNSSFTLVRLNTDGEPDNTFGGGGIAISGVSATFTEINDAALQSDGKILMLGELSSSPDFVLVRFNSNGMFDNTFGNSGMAENDLPLSFAGLGKMAVHSGDKIVTVGTTPDPTGKFLVVRHTANGLLDDGFGNQGFKSVQMADSNSFALAVLVQADQKIVVAGSAIKAAKRTNAVARFFQGQLEVADLLSLTQAALVYPNPATSELTLSYTLSTSESISIDLVDATGKVWVSFLKDALRVPGDYNESLSLPANLAAGSYYLLISSPSGKSAVRFIKG